MKSQQGGDALGSVRQLTDGGGAITLAQNYDPYGNAVSSTGATASIYGYTGEQQDPSTGMVYLRTRYYDSGLGRFMSRDTWSGSQNQPMSYNSWLYTYANPINLSDPTGMNPADQGYCNSIAGSSSYVQCEKIVRGLDPRDTTISDIEAYDATGGTPDCILYTKLDLPGTKLDKSIPTKKSEDYGFWFHCHQR